MIFYLNQDPPDAHSFNLEAADATIVGSNNALGLTYPTCGSSQKNAVGLFMSDPATGQSVCFRRETLRLLPPEFNFSSSTPPGTITVKVQPAVFSESDYVTIGFYNTNSSGFPSGTFSFTARDLNRYYFGR